MARGMAFSPHRERLAAALAEARSQGACAKDALADLETRVNNAQQLANMGDYDWHIETDTNRWSDQLYRIFGHEPQSRNMDYATYFEHCHPDDRPMITAVHEQSFATSDSWQMTHRIVRSDGEVRHLLCNGEVVTCPDGTPVSMRGTVVDITDRVLADQERERLVARDRDERLRRRAALEINDTVVQGLTAALYALETEDNEAVAGYVRRTLNAAQHLISDLVVVDGEAPAPGDLVRGSAGTLTGA